MCRTLRHESVIGAEQSDPRESSGPINDVHRIAHEVARSVGLRCVDDIQSLAMVVYVATLNGPPHPQPWTNRVAIELRRQIVIWAWEEGQNGGSLPVIEASPDAPQRQHLVQSEGKEST